MHALIRWRNMLHDDEEESGRGNYLDIIAYGAKELHPTWFLSKQSAQRFLDVLSAQVKPNTSPETFAERPVTLDSRGALRLGLGCDSRRYYQ
jgi:hypothetical protein